MEYNKLGYEKLKFSVKMKLCAVPAVLGVLLFYILPFAKVILYSVIRGQYQWKFVGLYHYKTVITNPYFQMACKNTLLLILFCVPVYLLGAIAISVVCSKKGIIGRFLRKISVLPLFLPSVSIVGAFLAVFQKMDSPVPIYSMFLWKYIGMGVVILSAAFAAVDSELYEAARIDGAGFFDICRKITIPICKGPIKFTVILGIVYSFRTFRESFLYYGTNYPPDDSYTLQYYMNNQFLRLNYQTMAAASILITFLISVLIVLCRIERRKDV